MFQKKVCRDCHFLSKECADFKGSFNLNEKEREDIKNNNYDFLKQNHFSLYCFKEKWDENIIGGENLKNERANNLNKIKRNNCRFFYKYQKGSTFKNIENEINFKEKKKEKNMDFKRAFFLIVITAVITTFINNLYK